MMRKLLLSLSLILCMPPATFAASRGMLAKLNAVEIIIEELGDVDKELGVTESDLKAQLIVLLKNKLPRLRLVESSLAEYLYLNVGLHKAKTVSGQVTVDYYGSVSLSAYRIGSIRATNKIAPVIVWNRTFSVSGSRSAFQNVRETIEILTTQLAADWFADNP